MIYVAAAIALIGYLCLLAWTFAESMEDYRVFSVWKIACFGLAVGGVALLFYAGDQEEMKGPCLRYETSMHYNAATKTMMPARHCAERAEWVKP